MYLDLTPETEEYLAKYDGDLTKALNAAANAQSLIGRQGNELGDVRRELQELRERLDTRAADRAAVPDVHSRS